MIPLEDITTVSLYHWTFKQGIELLSGVIKPDYKDKILLLGIRLLDKNTGCPVKFAFQGNNAIFGTYLYEIICYFSEMQI